MKRWEFALKCQDVAFAWLIGLTWIGKLQGQMGLSEDLEAQGNLSQIKVEGRLLGGGSVCL